MLILLSKISAFIHDFDKNDLVFNGGLLCYTHIFCSVFAI